MRNNGLSHPRRAVATPRVRHAHARTHACTHFIRRIFTCCSTAVRLRSHKIRPSFLLIFPRPLIKYSHRKSYSLSAANLCQFINSNRKTRRNTRENCAPEVLRMRRRDGSRLFVVCSISCLSARSTMEAPSAGEMKDFTRGRDIHSFGHQLGP